MSSQFDPADAGERVVRRHHENSSDLLPAAGVQIAGGHRLPDNAKVHEAGFYQLQNALLGPVKNGKLHVRKVAAVFLEKVGQQVKQGGKRSGNLQAAVEQIFYFRQFFLDILIGAQDRLGEGQHFLASRGKLDTPLADSFQEPAGKFLLQSFNLLAQGRLGPQGRFRGPGEASQLGHMIESYELLPFH